MLCNGSGKTASLILRRKLGDPLTGGGGGGGRGVSPLAANIS